MCFVSIIHMTRFYLLFNGDTADQIYMEVELRRVTWLQHHLVELGNASLMTLIPYYNYTL